MGTPFTGRRVARRCVVLFQAGSDRCLKLLVFIIRIVLYFAQVRRRRLCVRNVIGNVVGCRIAMHLDYKNGVSLSFRLYQIINTALRTA